MSEFQQSQGEQATATTYSRGRIRFYSVAKSSNLYGPESAPRACDPWLSIRSRKERATAKFRELLRLLLIRRRWRCSQPSFFTAEGHLDEETTRRRKSLPFALFRRILSRNCYLTSWLPRKFDTQVQPATEISEQVVEIINEVSLNTTCLQKNVDINFDYLYVFCIEIQLFIYYRKLKEQLISTGVGIIYMMYHCQEFWWLRLRSKMMRRKETRRKINFRRSNCWCGKLLKEEMERVRLSTIFYSYITMYLQ